ncbi:MAG TPA: aminotransferase class I/II-fold pyridoxal phosphate-dependent enzyme [Gaiellaceae bacterium]
MLDFTSALYLGFRHPSVSLPPWEQLTTGVPAALAEPPAAKEAAAALARLQGCERGTLAVSTLHLFFDLFPLLAGPAAAIHVDAGAYPIARWGVERAQARGVSAHTFPRGDADALERALRVTGRGRRPIVVCDGWRPGFGPPPLAAYCSLARRFGGLLVVDDTQALGILGERLGPAAPFGHGGGGSLRHHGIRAGEDVVVVASLAKGFGVPVAVLSGGAGLVGRFERRSATRVHCSPPSAAMVQAAQRALALNERVGESRRARLAELVQRFRARAAAAGFRAHGGLFPVQTVATGEQASALFDRLARRAIRAVLHDGSGTRDARLSFLITARHRPEEIDAAVSALGAPHARVAVR